LLTNARIGAVESDVKFEIADFIEGVIEDASGEDSSNAGMRASCAVDGEGSCSTTDTRRAVLSGSHLANKVVRMLCGTREFNM
jgi:hypothetical protein